MKKTLFVLLVLLFGAAAFAQTAPIKIGYVNSETIMQQYPEAIKAQGELDAKIATWNGTLDSMSVAFQAAIDNYKKLQATMTDPARQQMEQQLIAQQGTIEEYKRAKFTQGTGEAFILQEQLLSPVRAKVFKIIEVIAKEEGMNFVFDKPGDMFLLYADQTFDVTFKVLDRLKRGS